MTLTYYDLFLANLLMHRERTSAFTSDLSTALGLAISYRAICNAAWLDCMLKPCGLLGSMLHTCVTTLHLQQTASNCSTCIKVNKYHSTVHILLDALGCNRYCRLTHDVRLQTVTPACCAAEMQPASNAVIADTATKKQGNCLQCNAYTALRLGQQSAAALGCACHGVCLQPCCCSRRCPEVC
jgi:hypothetical protein